MDNAKHTYEQITQFLKDKLYLDISPKSKIQKATAPVEFVGYLITPHGIRMRKKTTNLIAGIVAVVLSVAIAAAYIIMMEATLTAKLAVYLIALMLFSWLGAMLGFDKVTQMILQIVNAAPGKGK